MDKIERVDAVLSGEEADRPPLTLWYHFGVQHGRGSSFARLILDYFHYYDFDYLKVMNDYFYPMPEGLSSVKSVDDLSRISHFSVESSPWKEQLNALDLISRELSGKAYFIDTVFDPWHTFKRSLAGEEIVRLMDEEPEATLEALQIITDNIVEYSRKSIGRGSAGIFLSMVAGSELIKREHFLTFVKPFALKVLEGVSGMGKLNVVHVHGEDLFFEDCLDLPADVFNWWDRGPKGPSLSWALERIDGCVMGGIDHTLVNRRTPGFLRSHAKEAKSLGGKVRFLLAGGCSISTSVAPRAIKAVVAGGRD